MVTISTRSDIVVEEHDEGATLTLFARNPVVSWIALTGWAFLSVMPIALVAYGISASNYGMVFVMSCMTAAVLWLTWRIGWRARPFQLSFSSSFLQAGPHRYAYSDIQSFGLSRYGGDVLVTVSIGVPRNITIGPHVYIEVGERNLPITVGLKDAQAKEVLRLFGHLFDQYRSV